VAVPARVYVGLTVFGLVATLVVVPYTLLVVTCDPAGAGHIPFLRQDCSVFTWEKKVFLGLASAFTLAFTIVWWRALVAAARRDAAIRRAIRERQGASLPVHAKPGPPKSPPGVS
jgi:hypothetical protein